MEKPPELNPEIEKELDSPAVNVEEIPEEIKEEVMKIVTDLFKSGFGVTALKGSGSRYVDNLEGGLIILKSTLEKGLLGIFEHGGRSANRHWLNKDIIEKFKYFARKKRTGVVMGNIIGRDIGLNKKHSSDGVYPYFHTGISILFDVSNKSEVLPGPVDQDKDKGSIDRFNDKARQTKTNEMWAYTTYHQGYNKIFSEIEIDALVKLKILGVNRNIDIIDLKLEILSRREDLENEGVDFKKLSNKLEKINSMSDMFTDPTADDGFVLGRRIAPREFRGVLWQAPDKKSFKKADLNDLKQIELIVHEFYLASLESGKNHFLPIYDSWGNLWWPERISHEDIIKMEEEKKVKKEE
jgi:hypothetical protein